MITLIISPGQSSKTGPKFTPYQFQTVFDSIESSNPYINASRNLYQAYNNLLCFFHVGCQVTVQRIVLTPMLCLQIGSRLS